VASLAGLTESDRDGVTHLVLHALDATAADLAQIPALRHVFRTGPAHVEGAVTDITGHATTERADHTMAMALSLLRGLTGPAALRRSSTLTFAILGLGRVGTAVALRAKAFGFKVVFHDPNTPPAMEDAIGLARARTLQALLLKADILAIQTPDLPGLLGLPELAILPHGALVIDTTGHRTLDHTALAALLADGHIAAAGLDLPAGGPSPAGVALVTHHAGESGEAIDDLRRRTAEAIKASASF
jgi:C-terminal binding protein